MKIYMADIRKAKMCSGGARAFFLEHGLDWQNFLKNGIDLEKIRATNDAMALQVVRVVEDGRKK